MNQTFMKTKETDILAEAYTALSNLAQKAFITPINGESNQTDTYFFIQNLVSQVNLYRVAIINRDKSD